MCLLNELLCSLVLILSCVVSAQSTPFHTSSAVSTHTSININTNSGSSVSTHSSTNTFSTTSVHQAGAGTEHDEKAKEKQYYLSNEKVNWFTAMQMCRSLGKQPVSIATEEEYTKLYQLMKDSGKKADYWTSGTDLGEEGTFTWMGSGRPLTFTAWVNGQPDNNGGAENCLELASYSNWEFNDDKCHTKNYFICEY